MFRGQRKCRPNYLLVVRTEGAMRMRTCLAFISVTNLCVSVANARAYALLKVSRDVFIEAGIVAPR